MRHVASVAGRELRSLFVSPVAYGVLSLFSVLAGMFFILDLGWFEQVFFQFRPDQLTDFNLNDGLIHEFSCSISLNLPFLIPGTTMGGYAAERPPATEELVPPTLLTICDNARS